jgi:glycosyltransferase involved in cell wall biosynthesis
MITLRMMLMYLACTFVPGRRTVLTFHSGGYPTTPEGRVMTRRSFAAFVFRRIDHIIAVNTEIEAFFHRLGVAPSRVSVIAPHAFVEGEGPSTDLPDSLAGFTRAHHPLLVSVGGLEPEYDVPAQIELLGRVRTEWPRAGLVVIGSGSLAKDLQRQVALRADACHIMLAGDVPHAVTLRMIAQADVLLRTTLYDGDAISVREALHLGTPVVATQTVLRPAGVTLVPLGSPDALEQATLQVLASPRKTSAQTPKADERNLEDVLKVYQSLLGSHLEPQNADKSTASFVPSRQ